MSGVPYTFATATTSIPLSQLDANFATVATLGNASVGLGNTTSVVGNLTLQNVTITSGTSNITTNVASVTGILPQANGGTGTTTGYYGFKNRIINGAMNLYQRATGTVTPTAWTYTLDRWNVETTVASKFTVQQSSSAPAGFNNSYLLTSTSAYSVSSGDTIAVAQYIEGYNWADLGWGTANAKTVTLSFWVQSSLTGTFGGSIENYARTRSYPFIYTISSANTWTQISVTIAGDTSGTWVGASNAGAVCVLFEIGAGSTFSGTAGSWASADYRGATGATNILGTNGATFYITGVQFEVGTQATSFDYRPYGTELALCQRYYYQTSPLNTGGTLSAVAYMVGGVESSTGVVCAMPLSVTMRAAPSLALPNCNLYTFASITSAPLTINTNRSTSTNAGAAFTVSGCTGGQAAYVYAQSTSAFVQLSAEL